MADVSDVLSAIALVISGYAVYEARKSRVASEVQADLARRQLDAQSTDDAVAEQAYCNFVWMALFASRSIRDELLYRTGKELPFDGMLSALNVDDFTRAAEHLRMTRDAEMLVFAVGHLRELFDAGELPEDRIVWRDALNLIDESARAAVHAAPDEPIDGSVSQFLQRYLASRRNELRRR